MKLNLSGLRKLPHLATALLTLTAALASAGATAALAQQPAAGGSPASAQNAPMGTPMGAPMGQALGANGSEPLQRSVDAGRQAAGGDASAAGGSPLPADQGNAPAPGSPEAAAAAAAASGEPQPLASLTSVGADYKIGPSDLLDFDVYGVPDMQRTVRVNASGVVSLPLVGPVMLAGLTTAQAETLIAARYEKDFLQNPQVSLFIKEFTSQRITIEGAVAKPGIYPVIGQLTLLRALALAGGGGQYAQLNEIMLFRGGSTLDANTQTFDLEKIRSGEVQDPLISADDVIVVKRDSRRTALRDSLFSDFLTTINPFK